MKIEFCRLEKYFEMFIKKVIPILLLSTLLCGCSQKECKFFKLLNTTNVHFEAGFIVTFCKDTFAFEFLIKQGLQMFVTFLRTKNVNNVSVCEFRNIY